MDTSTPEAQTEDASWPTLASKMFPNTYVGEVPKPAEAPQESQEEAQEAAEETPEKAQEPEKVQEPDEEPISSLSELIQTNEFDPEWFDSLEVEVKVDGNPSKASLADLRKSYQMTEAAEKRLEEAKQKVKAQHQAIAEKQSKADETFQIAARLVDKAKQKLVAKTEKIDWETLKDKDPAEFAAKKLQAQEEAQAITQLEQEALSEYQQALQAQQEEMSTKRQEMLQAEGAALLEKIPEWNDPEVRTNEDKEVTQYLTAQGFTPEDIQGASDHRLIVMARKAMKFDSAQSAEPAKKQLRKVPKMLKGGTPKPQDQINSDELKKARDRLRKTGKMEDAMRVRRLERELKHGTAS